MGEFTMSIIKVSTNIFSAIKTIEKALTRAVRNDEISLAPATYKENISIIENVTIYGQSSEQTIFEGILIVPKGIKARFQHIYFRPSSHFQIEGDAIFEHCHFQGVHTKAIFSVTKGHLTMKNCVMEGASDIGIAAFNESNITVQDCQFTNNGKTHLLVENAKVTVENSELSHANHALWLKQEAHCVSKHNYFHHHKGTQCIVQHAYFEDLGSELSNSDGNGIYASKHAQVKLSETSIKKHQLPQIWLQESQLEAKYMMITNGNECGLMVSEQSSAELSICTIKQHKISNVQITGESRANFEGCQIHNCEGIGIQVKNSSIANFAKTTISNHTLTQLFISDRSIVSMNETEISKGKHVGIIAEKYSNCTILNSVLREHSNSGMTTLDSEVTVLESKIEQNGGNGILALSNGKLHVDQCTFIDNDMPHIGGKNGAVIHLNKSHFSYGKSVYITEKCDLTIENCRFSNSKGVQIELDDMSKGTIRESNITNGTTNAIKVQRDSSVAIYNTHISEHLLPQIVVNDSSLLMDECEVLDGHRNGFIIEHHSEANIKNTFISRHGYPQIWVDRDSVVDLLGVQLLDSKESDLYVQNNSRLYANNCIIRNKHFQYTIQAINHSTIELANSFIESPFNNCYLQQNNSSISSSFDEVSE